MLHTKPCVTPKMDASLTSPQCANGAALMQHGAVVNQVNIRNMLANFEKATLVPAHEKSVW